MWLRAPSGRHTALLAVVVAACSADPRPPAASTPEVTARAREPATPSTAAVTQLAVGHAHTCALHADGTASCWGANAAGQLGVPTLARSPQPIAMPSIRDAVGITAAESSTCILKADRTVHCWGHLGTSSEAREPAQIASDVVELAGRCFRTAGGRIECLTEQAQVVTIDGIVGATQIAATTAHRGCALVERGHVKCWFDGQVHDIAGVANATKVVMDRGGGCALLASGEVRCWFLVDAKTAPISLEVVSSAHELHGGEDRLCARVGDKLQCWKDRDVDARKVELDVPPGAPIASGHHTCVGAGGRDVRCFGAGLDGQLGNGWWARRPVPTRVPGIENAVQLATAHHGRATCARTEGGGAACWGMLPTTMQPRPQRIAGSRVRTLVDSESVRYIDERGRLYAASYYPWGGTSLSIVERDVIAASDHCFVKSGGRVRCWQGYREDDAEYARIPRITDAVAVASHSEGGFVCARRAGGRVACFHPNSERVKEELDDVIDLAITDAVSCAIRGDRSLWCWGLTSNMIFGIEGKGEEVPLTKMPVGEVTALAMTRDNVCVVRDGGAVACWGANHAGQLGDGTFVPRAHPFDVVGIRDAVDVHVGGDHACALHRDGGVSCWGATDRGQIGTHAMMDVETPSAVVWP